ncbi:MAG: FAD-dependent oxidoreductase [Gammaproteobacteria bacterium]|nr:FAD-dependent oxidoreductase [Gammaproteobacteria bacterium]
MSVTNKIVIVGAGAAGLACAISSATSGADVTLVEKTPYLGGTVAHSLVHTIGGLYDDVGDYINGGLPVQLAARLLEADSRTCKRQMGKLWVLSVDPAIYEQVIEEWIGQYPNISVLRNASPGEIHVGGKNKDRVTHLDVIVGGDESGLNQLPTHALVDTTGGADVVRRIAANKFTSGDALAGLIFQIRGVVPNAFRFPKNVAIQRAVQKAAEAGDLPNILRKTWFDIGIHEDEIYAKASLLTHAYDETIL